MSQHYDVVIVGGGMVGATLAIALSQSEQLKIALVEANQPAKLNAEDSWDNRVSALTAFSETLLKQLGIWSELIPERISPFTDMRVWESADTELHYDCAEMNAPWLGHLLENRHIQQACLRCCERQANIDLIIPAHPVSYSTNRLRLDNGTELSAELIVAADGANSKLRDWAGIAVQGWDYHQQGLVATATTEQAHQDTAWQRFLSEGPLAFLPLPDKHQCSIVWSLNEQNAKRLLALDENEFIAELNEAFQFKLGAVTQVQDQAAFPLKLRHAQNYIQANFALVGDAAHTIHPLAGQGVNIGFLDAATLAEVVIEAAEKGRHIGSLHTLQKYQRRRRADNVLMQFSMDAFKRTFSSKLPLIGWLRNLGLRSVNQSPFIKQTFIQQAAVRSFAKPTLAQFNRHKKSS